MTIDITNKVDGHYTIAFASMQLEEIRAAVVWRYPGAEWVREHCGFVSTETIEKGWLLRYSFSCLEAEIRIQVEGNEAKYSGVLRHKGSRAVELARFHLFEGLLDAGFSFRSYQSVTGNTRVYTDDDAILPYTEEFEALWQSYGEYWLRLEEPVHGEPNWAVSGDVGHFFRGNAGFTIGFYAPGTAAGEIAMRTQTGGKSPIYGAVLLDNILFEPGEERILEKAAVIEAAAGLGFSRWADLCTEMAKPRLSQPYLGFCSWYQKFSAIDENEFQMASEEFSALTDTNIPVVVQLDDGYQAMPGDWNQPNSKFAKSFQKLPEILRERGELPGLWIAPTAIWSGHPLVQEHPDAIQHCADGSAPIRFCNWGWCDPENTQGTTYFLEPGHPVTEEMIRKTVADAVAAGWKYLKIDFTYCISERRLAYDRKHTVFELHRDLYRIAREAAGEDIVICACICGLYRHAIGYADTQRIGGDVTADVESFRRSLADCVTRASVGGKWWTADTDVFYMRDMETMNLEQEWIWTGTVGAVGSVFLTSDSPSQWSAEALRRVRYFWRDGGIAPPEKIVLQYGTDGTISAVYVKNRYGRRVLVYNWKNQSAEVCVDLDEFGLEGTPDEIFPDGISCRSEGALLRCVGLPPESMRILEY